MRQVFLIALSLISISALAGCTIVDPVYSHQMGGFPMPGEVQQVKGATISSVKKVSKPVLLES